MDSGLFALATRRLTRLAGAWPEHAEVAYLLGRCEAARGNMEAALKLWARIPPDSPWAAPAAEAFARAAIPLGHLAEAERILRSAIGRAGSEQSALRRLLLTLLGQQGRLGEARGLIESLWREGGSIREDQVADRLAMLREHMGLDLEPFPMEWNLSQLEEGSAAAGDEDRRILGLARAHLASRAGDFERARAELESCLRRSPSDPAIWKAWLDWTVAAGRPVLAREALDHVPAALLDDAEILSLKAWFARMRQDVAIERGTLEQLIALEPGRAQELTRLAEHPPPGRRDRRGRGAPRVARMSSTPHSTVTCASIGRTGSPRTLSNWPRWRSSWAGGSRPSVSGSWSQSGTRRTRTPGRHWPAWTLRDRRGRSRVRGRGRSPRSSASSPPPGRRRRCKPAMRRSRSPDSRTVQGPRGSPILSRTMAYRPSISSPRCQAAASGCSTSTATAGSTSTACRAGGSRPSPASPSAGRPALPQPGRRHVRGRHRPVGHRRPCLAATATASPWATTTTTATPTCS